MARFIGKCLTCKQITARDYTETKATTNRLGRKVNVAGRTVHGRFVRASEDFECQSCGAYQWNGKRVEGLTTSQKCDARCTEAKGHKCECACGGKNHGQGWIVCQSVAA